MDTKQHPILLFDGICNLCNNTVQRIIEQDKEAIFRFASLQSTIGMSLLEQYKVPHQTESVVLIHDNRVYLYSDAPLEIVRLLGRYWQIAYVFKIVPSFLRNLLYRLIAKNRYRWFGKQESCWLPTPDLRERFL